MFLPLLRVIFDGALTGAAAIVLVLYDYGADFAVLAVLPGEGMVTPTGRARLRLTFY